MKQCLICNSQYSTSRRDCPSCGALTAIIDGFDAYAPYFAHEGGGFNAGCFSELARLEETSFWFRARNEIIFWALNQYVANFNSFLEIGCGTGFVLTGVAEHYPGARLSGSEIFLEGLKFAARRLPKVHLMQMDARQIPFINEFDVIGSFDVIEHIKEDMMVLCQMHKALKADGVLLLTVPQHTWLWSVADEYACHERRYAPTQITKKVKMAGFSIIKTTSFVTTLLPALVVSRAFQKCQPAKFDPTAELRINPALNTLFAHLLSLELRGIKLGMSYPMGGSRLVVAKKLENYAFARS